MAWLCFAEIQPLVGIKVGPEVLFGNIATRLPIDTAERRELQRSIPVYWYSNRLLFPVYNTPQTVMAA
jgi:hypothetical protein